MNTMPQCRGPAPTAGPARSSPLGDAFHVFDTTLRDGAQREGITYSVADKIAVATLLDELGVGFIEGGWPGAMPKDTEFFARARGRRAGAAHRVAGRIRRHPQGRASAPRTTRRSGAAGLRRAGDHPGGQVRRPARRAGAAHHPGREPGDGVRHRCAAGGQRPPGVPGLRALLRRLRRSTATTACGWRRRRSSAGADVVVMCDTNGGMLPMAVHAGRRRGAGAHRFPARHPLPGRHRLRGGEHRRRGAGRRHPCAVHRQRVRRAGRQRRPVRGGRQPGHQDGPAGAAGRRAGRDDAGLARAGRAGQHRPEHPPGLRRVVGVLAQGRAARLGDQGRPGPVQPPGSRPWSATTCTS